MVNIQILNKVLLSENIALIEDNNLTREHFIGYENEFDFIIEHWRKYNKTPDRHSFLDKFQEFDFFDVTENDDYLIATIQEEYLYYKTVPIIQKCAEILKVDANAAAEYLLSEMKNLNPEYDINTTAIDSQIHSRIETFKNKQENKDNWYITTGLHELDAIINGWARKEELVVIYARTGHGKSWLIAKTLSHAWKTGHVVGLISPEMSPEKVGYRIDTLIGNFSNSGLNWGNQNKVDIEKYLEYADKLKNRNDFCVSTPADFNKKITVSKLRQFIKKYKIDILGIDGITYLSDERAQRGDNKTISLTNISEDLIQLSNELNVPILVVVQSNRGGVVSDGTPDLENIRDSDGIAQLY